MGNVPWSTYYPNSLKTWTSYSRWPRVMQPEMPNICVSTYTAQLGAFLTQDVASCSVLYICMYEVWSDLNAQGEIIWIRIILKPPYFQNIFRPSHNQFERTFCRGPSTTEWQQRTHLWRWFGQPPTGLSWDFNGTARGQPTLTSLSKREKSPLGQYLVNRVSRGLPSHLRRHLIS